MVWNAIAPIVSIINAMRAAASLVRRFVTYILQCAQTRLDYHLSMCADNSEKWAE